MRVVVTGAAGLTGGEVVRLLVARGYDVIAIVRRDAARAAVPVGARVAIADCAVTDSLDPYLADCDVLVHGAGILLGAAVARTTRLHDVGALVVLSSAGIRSAHRRSAGLYRAGETAIREARPDATILRPTMIYGSSRDRNIHHVIRFAERYRFLPLFGRGDALLQPIHFADLATATVAIAGRHPGVTLEAAGPRPITIREAAETIFAALHITPRFMRVPLGPAIGAARAVDAVGGSRIAERLERMVEDRSVVDPRLLEFTGVSPREFDLGVRDQVREMRAGAP